ncbi:MAG: hypothetical protein FWF90_16165 [Promicromonosporaceae bacterium]|nr:hypothetical protein [Promicromonosporaceae bacterium]
MSELDEALDLALSELPGELIELWLDDHARIWMRLTPETGAFTITPDIADALADQMERSLRLGDALAGASDNVVVQVSLSFQFIGGPEEYVPLDAELERLAKQLRILARIAGGAADA